MQDVNSKWIVGHKVTATETTGDYDLIYGETPARTQGPPPHMHSGYHEVFLVTKGQMNFMINGEVIALNAGESINLPPNTLHTFENSRDEECHWVNIHSPKGFRSFFEEFGISDEEVDARSKSIDQDLVGRLIQEAANYDMHIKI